MARDAPKSSKWDGYALGLLTYGFDVVATRSVKADTHGRNELRVDERQAKPCIVEVASNSSRRHAAYCKHATGGALS